MLIRIRRDYPVYPSCCVIPPGGEHAATARWGTSIEDTERTSMSLEIGISGLLELDVPPFLGSFDEDANADASQSPGRLLRGERFEPCSFTSPLREPALRSL